MSADPGQTDEHGGIGLIVEARKVVVKRFHCSGLVPKGHKELDEASVGKVPGVKLISGVGACLTALAGSV